VISSTTFYSLISAFQRRQRSSGPDHDILLTHSTAQSASAMLTPLVLNSSTYTFSTVLFTIYAFQVAFSSLLPAFLCQSSHPLNFLSIQANILPAYIYPPIFTLFVFSPSFLHTPNTGITYWYSDAYQRYLTSETLLFRFEKAQSIVATSDSIIRPSVICKRQRTSRNRLLHSAVKRGKCSHFLNPSICTQHHSTHTHHPAFNPDISHVRLYQ